MSSLHTLQHVQRCKDYSNLKLNQILPEVFLQSTAAGIVLVYISYAWDAEGGIESSIHLNILLSECRANDGFDTLVQYPPSNGPPGAFVNTTNSLTSTYLMYGQTTPLILPSNLTEVIVCQLCHGLLHAIDCYTRVLQAKCGCMCTNISHNGTRRMTDWIYLQLDFIADFPAPPDLNSSDYNIQLTAVSAYGSKVNSVRSLSQVLTSCIQIYKLDMIETSHVTAGLPKGFSLKSLLKCFPASTHSQLHQVSDCLWISKGMTSLNIVIKRLSSFCRLIQLSTGQMSSTQAALLAYGRWSNAGAKLIWLPKSCNFKLASYILLDRRNDATP